MIIRPYPSDPQNPVNVIRHDHKFVQFHQRKMIGNGAPTLLRHLPRIIQPHFRTCDFTKQAGASTGADGNEIRPSLRIVISF